MRNRNLILVILSSVMIGSAGLFYWLNRDPCRSFSQKEIETTCGEAQNIALQAYPGKIEDIRLQGELVSERNITPHPYWLVDIRLASPLYFEKFQRDVQKVIVKVTMDRGVDLYEIGE